MFLSFCYIGLIMLHKIFVHRILRDIGDFKNNRGNVNLIYMSLLIHSVMDLFYIIGSISYSYLYPRVEKDINEYFLNNIHDMNFENITKLGSGEIVSNLQNLKDNTINILTIIFGKIIPFSLLFTYNFYQLSNIHWLILLLFAILSIVFFASGSLLSYLLNNTGKEIIKNQSKISNFFNNVIENKEISSVYHMNNYENNYLNILQKDQIQANTNQYNIFTLINFLQRFFILLLQRFLIPYIMHMKSTIVNDEELSNILLLLNSIVGSFFDISTKIPDFFQKWTENEQINKNIFNIINNNQKFLSLPEETIFINNFIIRDLKDNNLILQIDNLEINPGEKILVVGKSGSGKTTFFRCLLGLLNYYQGDIYYGNQNLRNILLDNISYIPAHHYIIEDSIKNNICFDNDNNLEEILKLSVLEDLDIHQIADKNILSTGQRQRINIARALKKNGNILIADEPFSALNKELKQIIGQNLVDNFKTIICSDHSNYFLNFADSVILIQDYQMTKMTKKEYLNKYKIDNNE